MFSGTVEFFFSHIMLLTQYLSTCHWINQSAARVYPISNVMYTRLKFFPNLGPTNKIKQRKLNSSVSLIINIKLL